MPANSTPLWDTFNRLGDPGRESSGSEILCAYRIPDSRDLWLARDSCSRPVLVIGGRDVNESAAPITLRHIGYLPAVECLLGDCDGPISGNFQLIRCRSRDVSLQECFVWALAGWLPLIDSCNSGAQVDRCVEQFFALFCQLTLPGNGTLVGIWGELYLMACCADPHTAIAAWHNDPEELHDFVCGENRVEVKTSTGVLRQHHFSLDQFLVPAGATLTVASLLVVPTPNGWTVSELVDSLCGHIKDNPAAIARIHDVVGRTLGAEWREADRVRLSPRDGGQAVVLYDADVIPRVRPAAVPPEVSGVTFWVDLSQCSPLGTDRSSTGLVASMLKGLSGALDGETR